MRASPPCPRPCPSLARAWRRAGQAAPDEGRELKNKELARTLLQKHGVLAGLLNTLLPLPTIPLMLAAQGGHEEMVRMLVGARADVSAKKDDGQTVLILAAKGGHAKACEVLARQGRDQQLLSVCSTGIV